MHRAEAVSDTSLSSRNTAAAQLKNGKEGFMEKDRIFSATDSEKENIISCMIALGRHGGVKGLIGMEVSLTRLADENNFFSNSNSCLAERFLLDEHGRIMLAWYSSLSKNPGKTIAEKNGYSTSFYKNNRVFPRILKMKTGMLNIWENNREYTYLFCPIQTLGWIYVEKMDLQRLTENTADDYMAQQMENADFLVRNILELF